MDLSTFRCYIDYILNIKHMIQIIHHGQSLGWISPCGIAINAFWKGLLQPLYRIPLRDGWLQASTHHIPSFDMSWNYFPFQRCLSMGRSFFFFFFFFFFSVAFVDKNCRRYKIGLLHTHSHTHTHFSHSSTGVGKCPFLGIWFPSPKQIFVGNYIPFRCSWVICSIHWDINPNPPNFNGLVESGKFTEKRPMIWRWEHRVVSSDSIFATPIHWKLGICYEMGDFIIIDVLFPL